MKNHIPKTTKQKLQDIFTIISLIKLTLCKSLYYSWENNYYCFSVLHHVFSQSLFQYLRQEGTVQFLPQISCESRQELIVMFYVLRQNRCINSPHLLLLSMILLVNPICEPIFASEYLSGIAVCIFLCAYLLPDLGATLI